MFAVAPKTPNASKFAVHFGYPPGVPLPRPLASGATPGQVRNENDNETENKTGEATYGGRFAPPSQVPPLLFSVSFSFSF